MNEDGVREGEAGKGENGKERFIRPKRAQTQVVTPKAAAPQDFLRHRSGVQWDSRERPLVTKAIRGLTRHWRTGAWISLVKLRREQSLTPFLQADPVYPRRQTIGKYHWTPDLCLENPRAKPGAFLSRMNPK